MQIVEGTIQMSRAVEIIREAEGAHFVEPITERQGDETHTYFRVQHEVRDDAIRLDRHRKNVFIETGSDGDSLFLKVRTGVHGMTAAEALAVPVVATLRFVQPADALDLADTLLDLAAAGFRSMDETRLADGADALRMLWPLANSSKPEPLPPVATAAA